MCWLWDKRWPLLSPLSLRRLIPGNRAPTHVLGSQHRERLVGPFVIRELTTSLPAIGSERMFTERAVLNGSPGQHNGGNFGHVRISGVPVQSTRGQRYGAEPGSGCVC